MKRRLLVGGFALLLLATVALGAVGGLLAVRVHAAEEAQDRRGAILDAARQEAVYLTSLDYKNVEKDIQHILEGATGEVQKTFAKKKGLIRKLLPDAKVVSKGEVLAAGIVNADQDSAQTLVVADSTVKNKKIPKGAIRHYRIWMTLVEKDGQWLVSKLSFRKPLG